MDLTLDRMERALERLDLTRPPFRVVQVLGTNGKGSTSTVLASLCTAHGLRTGLSVSPHFLSFTERIAIDAGPVSPHTLVSAANAVLQVDEGLTYFEWIILMALEVFRQSGVDVAVLEAGLGGAHDATTAVARDLLCYTPIALDHQAVLGNTLAAIARDKAAAVLPQVPVVSAAQAPEVMEILQQACDHAGTSLMVAPPLPHGLAGSLVLEGAHQIANAGLALEAFRHLLSFFSLHEDQLAVGQGLSAAHIPGRLQWIPEGSLPPLLLDGAHNPHGMQALVLALDRLGVRPSILVYATLADKDWPQVVTLLQGICHDIPCFFPQLTNPRALPSEHLARAWFGEEIPARCRYGHSVAETLQELEDTAKTLDCSEIHPVLVTGSLYLLSEVFRAHPEWLRARSAELA